jgi:hypothetical protein
MAPTLVGCEELFCNIFCARLLIVWVATNNFRQNAWIYFASMREHRQILAHQKKEKN